MYTGCLAPTNPTVADRVPWTAGNVSRPGWSTRLDPDPVNCDGWNAPRTRCDGRPEYRSPSQAQSQSRSDPAGQELPPRHRRRPAPPSSRRMKSPTPPPAGPMPYRVARALERAKLGARIADDNRGKEILLLDLRDADPADRLLRHRLGQLPTPGLRDRLRDRPGDEEARRGQARDGSAEEGRWILIDYGDFVVHVFSRGRPDLLRPRRDLGGRDRVEWRDPARIKCRRPPRRRRKGE